MRRITNRIVLTIAGACVEGDERRAPDVDFAPLCEVLHRTDRKIDGAVDLGEPAPAFVLFATVDDAEKSERRL